jgi:hypothetical protein
MNILTLDIWTAFPSAILSTFVLGLASHQMGTWVVRDEHAHSQRLIVGFNCLGLIGLSVGWLARPSIATIVVVSLACCWIISRTPNAILKARPAFARARSLKVPCGFQGCVATLIALVTLGPALTFPSSWDELTYHIALPMRWMHSQQFTTQADLPYSALPSLNEIVFTCVAPIDYAITPRLIAWLLWLAGAIQLRFVLRLLASNVRANILTAALSVSPIALMVSANSYVESLIWANTITLCGVVIKEFVEPNEFKTGRFALGTSVLIGGAIATKITAVGLGLLPILAVALCPSQARAYRSVIFGIGLAALFALPFYLRPWITCGNPLAPFFASWFTADPVAIQASDYHTALAVDNFGMSGLAGQVASPLAVAFASDLFDGSFGWQWLVIIFLAAYAAQRCARDERTPHRRLIQWVVPLSILLAAIWALTAQQARFGLPFYVTTTIAAAAGLESLSSRLRALVQAILLVFTVISLPWTNTGYYLDSWLSVCRLLPATDYVRDGTGDSYAELSAFLWENGRPEDRLITLFEHRLAYLPPQVEIATPYFQTKYFQHPQDQTASDIAAELVANEIQLVIFTERLIGPDIAGDYAALQQNWFRGIDQCIADGRLKIVWRGEYHAVARVASPK